MLLAAHLAGGIFAPASTPKDIVSALNREVDKAVALPDVRQRLDALGFEPAGISLAVGLLFLLNIVSL